MKLTTLAASLAIAGITSTALAATSTTSGTQSLTTQTDKLSYTIGVDLGNNLKAQNLQVSPALLAQGLEDALTGNKLLLTNQQMDDTLKQFQQETMSKQKADIAKISAENAKQGAAFLAKNKTEAGVVTLPSGLQYKEITAGAGTPPSKNDTVSVDYEGKLVNGQVFDSTYQRGQPAVFKVSQVIPGWQQALTLMKPGAEWMIYIPSNLAYGEQGVGGPIGPNETLIFKVHLLSVNSSKPATGADTQAKNG